MTDFPTLIEWNSLKADVLELLVTQKKKAIGHSVQSHPSIIPFSFFPGVYYATVYWMPTEKTIQVKNVLDRNGDAYGFYNNSVKTTGWGILEIKAGYGSQSLSNEIIMFAAGFLEGYLTAP